MNKNMGNNEDEVQKTVKDTEITVMMRCYLKKNDRQRDVR